MPYSKEQRKAYNAARRKQEKLQQQTTTSLVSPSNTPATSVAGPGVAGGGQAGPIINVDVPVEPVHKLTLKEKLLQKIQQQEQVPGAKPATANKGSRPAKKKQGDNMLTTVLPTVIASFVATYSQQLLPDEYKACAPNPGEVSGVIAPLMEILGRRVEVYSKASEDAVCLINTLLCAMMYGVRAYITYTDIKNSKEIPTNAEAIGNNPNAIISNVNTGNITGKRDYQATASRPARTDSNGVTIATHADASKDDAEYYRAFDEDDSGQTTRPESDIIADMFSRDKQGRAKLGLLRSAI